MGTIKLNIIPYFLGIRLDKQLEFSCHIQHIISKLSKILGMLHKIRDSLPIQDRKKYYYACMYYDISYNITSWAEPPIK